MQNHHRAPREMADVEAFAVSLRFRQHTYDMAVKAQREFIRANMGLAKRRLTEAVGLLIAETRWRGTQIINSNPGELARQTSHEQ